jgi:hypothetical protein
MQADTPAAIMLPLVARFLASVVSTELDEFVIRAKPHEFVISTARTVVEKSASSQPSRDPGPVTPDTKPLCPDGKSQLS